MWFERTTACGFEMLAFGGMVVRIFGGFFVPAGLRGGERLGLGFELCQVYSFIVMVRGLWG